MKASGKAISTWAYSTPGAEAMLGGNQGERLATLRERLSPGAHFPGRLFQVSAPRLKQPVGRSPQPVNCSAETAAGAQDAMDAVSNPHRGLHAASCSSSDHASYAKRLRHPRTLLPIGRPHRIPTSREIGGPAPRSRKGSLSSFGGESGGQMEHEGRFPMSPSRLSPHEYQGLGNRAG